MKVRQKLTNSLVWMASLGMICPAAAFADTTIQPAATAQATAPARIFDVALQPGGVLKGRVLDAQGQPLPSTPVTIHRDGVQVAQCVTDSCGGFSGSNLQGGVHQVVTPHGQHNARLWSPGCAPPVAGSDMCVVDGDVCCGQGPRFPILGNPYLIGAAIIAAIAIPLALDDDDDDAS